MKLSLSATLVCVFMCGIPLISCNDEEATTAPPPSGGALTATSTNVSVAPGASATATLSGGTVPYAIQVAGDNTIASASLSGSTLTFTGVQGGYTSVVVVDASNSAIRIGASVTGPVTYTLFPLTVGNQYVYDGYAKNTSVNGGGRISDPNNVYNSVWTLIQSPIPGTSAIHDTTTLDVGVVVGASRLFILTQDVASGAFNFLQTLGPFFRAFAIEPVGRMDTTRFVRVADPSVGIGGTWIGFDSTYTSAVGSVRLEIVGTLVGGETITDSASALMQRDVVKFRTHRNIYIDGSIVVSNSTTSELWLQRDIGPVQVHIAEDTENLGHFRTVSSVMIQ